MIDKNTITKIILENLPANNPWQDLPFEKVLFQWWVTARNKSNLRLSDVGKQAFDMAQIQFYQYNINVEKSNFTKLMIEYGKKIKCPFYVGLKSHLYKSAYICVYDSKIAMLINLYGSFQEYIDSIKK